MSAWARESWEQRYAEREPPTTAEPHMHLATVVSELEAGEALDLACGSGRNAVWLAQRGWDVTAVDFSEVAIGHARELEERTGVTVAWTVADVLEYEPKERAFDLVTLFFLQLPARERDAAIRNAAGAVARGGTFLLAAHHSRNHAEGHHGPKDPEVLYTVEEVVPCLGELVIERAEVVRRPIETPEGPAAMIDTLVLARRR